MYVGEQYRIMGTQPIEIIERRRTVANGEGLIIWPSQGQNSGSISLGNPTRRVPALHSPFDKFLRLGGRSEEIS